MTPTSPPVNKADIIGWKNEVKTATRGTDKASREYALVELDGKDYWVQSAFAVGDAVPGVIIGEEAVRYARADLRSPNPNGLIIPVYSLVAVHTGQESGLFAGVSAYLEGDRPVLIKNEFIKKENVSTEKADVDGMQLYTLAMEAKTDVSKRELLRSALDTGSRFRDLIEAEMYAMEIAEEPVDPYEIGVVRSGATVYDKPSIKGRNLDLAAVDSRVRVLARTLQEERLNSGDSARWYKIEDPEGWIFGSYLENNGEAGY
jgi:hypothetical protein